MTTQHIQLAIKADPGDVWNALVDGALEGGACGVVVGRNLWQREAAEADALVEHLARRIHSVS